jgi:hypothetical protein
MKSLIRMRSLRKWGYREGACFVCLGDLRFFFSEAGEFC